MTSFLFQKIDNKQTKLISNVSVLLVAVAFATAVWVQVYSSNFLRLTVPALRQEDKTQAVSDSKTFSRYGVSFNYPANIEINSSSDSAASIIKLPEIQISVYKQLPASKQVFATQMLKAGNQYVMTWPGKLGKTQGDYWAKSSSLNGTLAPFGERLFMVQANDQSLVVVQLPNQPYSDGQLRVIESFAVTY